MCTMDAISDGRISLTGSVPGIVSLSLARPLIGVEDQGKRTLQA